MSAICSGNVRAQQDSILYHDMPMESQWGSTTVNDNFGCFVRFTPPYYPARLTGIRAYFRNAGNPSTIKYKVYGDISGQANGGVALLFQSPGPANNPSAGGAPNVDYTDFADLTQANIIINQGDVYAGVVQNTGFFGIGIDNAPNSNVAVDRQWQWMNVFGVDYWNTLASQAAAGQIGVTSFFIPVSTSIRDPEMNLYMSYDPGERLVILSVDEESITDALLQVTDITGRLQSVSACAAHPCVLDFSKKVNGIYCVSLFARQKKLTGKIAVY